MSEIIQAVRSELEANANEETKKSGARFFKEPVRSCGVKSADVSKIAKRQFRSLAGKTKKEVFELCEELWQSGVMEESFIACAWAYEMRACFSEGDIVLFERWINDYVGNWASCDTFCNHTVGAFLEMYPACIEKVKKWTGSGNRWLRRASAVSLILPAKKGLFEKDIFEIADTLLSDTDDLVQKGYGWMLKAACAQHEETVFHYVCSKKQTMPRTALRYAIEKMSREKKEAAMKK